MVLLGCPASGAATPDNSTTGPAKLTSALAAIEHKPLYNDATWGYEAVDERSGKVLAARGAQQMFDPGSTMKIYSIATVLKLYGPNYRFTTPVYKEGTVTNGTLNGNLVLVASGDMSLGLREQPNGTLYYENLPDLDQSYADIGLPGAVEPPGDPLSGLQQLAAAVRASGITRVTGNVVIDDRLFTTYNGFPDGLISPMWVNEDLVDVLAKPTTAGQAASISWRPMTASYTVQNQVATVAANGSTSIELKEPSPGHLVVSGQIAAGSAPTLVVHDVDDPSAFARTAFIQTLQQAGVSVEASATGPNPDPLLPPKGSYQQTQLVGQHVSAPLSQFANLILKVSYNRGADLMTCLAAVKTGSPDCQQGIVAEVKTISGFGVPSTVVFPFDGAGSDDRSRSTVAAMTEFLRKVASTSYGQALKDSLPVLGRSGTLANVLPHSPAAGHVQLKTGNRVVTTVAGQNNLVGNSLAGYIQTKSGKQVTFMVAVGNVPIPQLSEILTVTKQQAEMVAAMQRDL